MFRALLCTAVLTVALTAAHAEAGKFSFGGGSHSNRNNHWNRNYRHNYSHNYRHTYRSPVVKCYYQVCFYQADWTYKQHRVFTHLHDAQAFARQYQSHGHYASVSKTYSPYYNGPRLLVAPHAPAHNAWLP